MIPCVNTFILYILQAEVGLDYSTTGVWYAPISSEFFALSPTITVVLLTRPQSSLYIYIIHICAFTFYNAGLKFKDELLAILQIFLFLRYVLFNFQILFHHLTHAKCT